MSYLSFAKGSFTLAGSKKSTGQKAGTSTTHGDGDGDGDGI
jgi:hypothetical protein